MESIDRGLRVDPRGLHTTQVIPYISQSLRGFRSRAWEPTQCYFLGRSKFGRVRIFRIQFRLNRIALSPPKADHRVIVACTLLRVGKPETAQSAICSSGVLNNSASLPALTLEYSRNSSIRSARPSTSSWIRQTAPGGKPASVSSWLVNDGRLEPWFTWRLQRTDGIRRNAQILQSPNLAQRVSILSLIE